MITLKTSAFIVVHACEGDPIKTTFLISLFFLAANLVEAGIETLIFGKRFYHIFDVPLAIAFIAYAAYVVYWCAQFNASKGG